MHKFLCCCALTLSFLGTCLNAEEAIFVEQIGEHNPWRQTFLMSEKLYEGKSEFQNIVIFQNAEFGRVLALDGIIQTTEADEPFYHEMIVHVPMMAHGRAKRVLIIGGGDGGTLREVLRHKCVEKVTMVDLDGEVVSLSKKYLPNQSKGAFENPKTQLLIQDGIEFVKNTKDKFDVIICDTTDPVGPGEVLFTSDFYANCKKILNQNGLIVTQNGVPFINNGASAVALQNLVPHFKDARFFVTSVPTYVGSFMTFSFATDNPKYHDISVEELSRRLSALDGKMHYYTPEIHKASFALPQYIKDQRATTSKK